MKRFFAFLLVALVATLFVCTSAFAQVQVLFNVHPGGDVDLLPYQDLWGSVDMTSTDNQAWAFIDYTYNFSLYCAPSPQQIWGGGTYSCGSTTERGDMVEYYTRIWQDYGELCDIRAVYLNSFRVQNEMPIGDVGSFGAQALVDFLPVDTSGSIFPVRIGQGFSVNVTSYDDIRGNVDGVTVNDSVFSWHDVIANDSLWAIGDHVFDLSYQRYGINPSRGMSYWNMPTSMDVSMMALALRQPNHPYVRYLLFDQPFSTPRPGITLAPAQADLVDRELTVSTPGVAVMAGAMLPDGRLWSQAVPVQGGRATFTLPTDIPLEQIHISAVSLDGVTAIDPYELPALPSSLILGQNYPNPFNPSTTVPFELTVPAHVRLTVYNIRGQQVATLVDGEFTGGQHTARWDAFNVASGVYLCRLQAGNATKTIKMVLTR